MKTNYILNTTTLFLCVFCCLVASYNAVAQKKSKTRLKAYYEKISNDDKVISVILNKGSGLQIEGVPNAEIFLSMYDNEKEIELTSLFTDSNGETKLIIEANYVFPKDESGYSVITLNYNGNDSLKASKNKIKFKDLNIDISFDIVDSVKQIVVYAFNIDSIGNKLPINEVELHIGVERLFSTLYLQKNETDDKGIVSMEFPNDIAGDSIGNITLIVKIDDHRDYGTITKSAKINWGMIVDYNSKSNARSLFGDEAPLWMIISVIIILSGAWYHFILAIFKVLKMRRIDSGII